MSGTLSSTRLLTTTRYGHDHPCRRHGLSSPCQGRRRTCARAGYVRGAARSAWWWLPCSWWPSPVERCAGLLHPNLSYSSELCPNPAPRLSPCDSAVSVHQSAPRPQSFPSPTALAVPPKVTWCRMKTLSPTTAVFEVEETVGESDAGGVVGVHGEEVGSG